ncbi:hypothetical protein SKAU_G00230970 [Synaphobranchus kaupii]|uniref:Uncharacterized protein n=1 Tax=Synaphobranchus kaupii TaxID=118154 RepID=A0A9Q1F627_SYNKA|nr:hypothetical protein SKAU_G00230970 [Synaphobranchus kaupii]
MSLADSNTPSQEIVEPACEASRPWGIETPSLDWHGRRALSPTPPYPEDTEARFSDGRDNSRAKRSCGRRGQHLGGRAGRNQREEDQLKAWTRHQAVAGLNPERGTAVNKYPAGLPVKSNCSTSWMRDSPCHGYGSCT